MYNFKYQNYHFLSGKYIKNWVLALVYFLHFYRYSHRKWLKMRVFKCRGNDSSEECNGISYVSLTRYKHQVNVLPKNPFKSTSCKERN